MLAWLLYADSVYIFFKNRNYNLQVPIDLLGLTDSNLFLTYLIFHFHFNKT
jgi:hypothetical protein